MSDGLVARILRESAARIAAADAKVHEAECAFASGKFEEYFDREYAQAEQAVQDEYERAIEEQTSDGGDGEEDS